MRGGEGRPGSEEHPMHDLVGTFVLVPVLDRRLRVVRVVGDVAHLADDFDGRVVLVPVADVLDWNDRAHALRWGLE
jgi:hypothetical protein